MVHLAKQTSEKSRNVGVRFDVSHRRLYRSISLPTSPPASRQVRKRPIAILAAARLAQSNLRRSVFCLHTAGG
jgi:hypothetical protein